ncbi:nadph-dependent fmn reductase [Gonapodya prolifera JEL478]|uniref:Nadph-dependent fmn reductase n=1 Tax=Gonapodya prolifera (strain JEL478) TaxID=1344416 RepID=A0A139ADC0_GONPJ|nr:nadph-dependent fmn reductase [Gonapodya prolifera JEL478]|eukprot:KXS14584.1 nadph-dependent fmn reductase [Gonapodya prolifera JEL478]
MDASPSPTVQSATATHAAPPPPAQTPTPPHHAPPTGLHFVVVFGSMRRDRIGIRLVRFLARQIEARGNACTILDAMEENLPLLDRMYKEYARGTAPAQMERIAETLRRADAFVVVGGEYNHSIQPGLSNLVDHFLEEWFWRPAGVATYSAGSWGGTRAGVQLRSLLGEIGTAVVSGEVAVPRCQDAFEEDGSPKGHPGEWERRVGRFLSEVEWYARAMKAERAKGPTPY